MNPIPTATDLHLSAGDRNNFKWSLVTRLMTVSGLCHSSYGMFISLD